VTTKSGLSRRDVLQAVSLAALGGLAGGATSAQATTPTASAVRFPRRFLWGVATAGHQVEGNNTNADLWLLENVKPSIFVEPSGDACNSFELWATDLDLAKSIGLNSFRFSLEWSRIEPEPGTFSQAMLDHYRRIIDGCRERQLLPVVTFNHFTVPRWFAAQGGWENKAAPDLFARYCEFAARGLAEGIAIATTLNEPNLMRLLKWLPLPFPPGYDEARRAMLAAAARACGTMSFSSANVSDPEPMMPQLLEGHRRGLAAIKSVRPDLPVGVSLAIVDDQAVGEHSRRDQKRAEVYGDWMEAAKTSDFIGVQNYGRQRLDSNGPMMPPAGAELTHNHEEFFPASLEGAIRYAHEATGLPVIVTENGIDTPDDSRRAAYIPLAVAGMQRAIAAGIPVRGYIHWSLLDNFEWIFGYVPRLGLAEVDQKTFRRTLKPSASVLRKLAAHDPNA
jgi:beta-glucosidase